MAERTGSKNAYLDILYDFLPDDTIVPPETPHKFLNLKDPNHPVASTPCLLGAKPRFHQVREIRTLSSNAPDVNLPAFSN